MLSCFVLCCIVLCSLVLSCQWLSCECLVIVLRLSCVVLPCLVLSCDCLVLSCLDCLVLSYVVSSCHCLVLSCYCVAIVLSGLVLPCLVLSCDCFVFSFLFLSCLLSCDWLVLSCLVIDLSCLVLACGWLVLSCLVIGFFCLVLWLSCLFLSRLVIVLYCWVVLSLSLSWSCLLLLVVFKRYWSFCLTSFCPVFVLVCPPVPSILSSLILALPLSCLIGRGWRLACSLQCYQVSQVHWRSELFKVVSCCLVLPSIALSCPYLALSCHAKIKSHFDLVVLHIYQREIEEQLLVLRRTSCDRHSLPPVGSFHRPFLVCRNSQGYQGRRFLRHRSCILSCRVVSCRVLSFRVVSWKHNFNDTHIGSRKKIMVYIVLIYLFIDIFSGWSIWMLIPMTSSASGGLLVGLVTKYSGGVWKVRHDKVL